MTKKKKEDKKFNLELSPAQKDRLTEDMVRMQRKYIKGYRIVECPQCKHPYRGKWLVEVIQCTRCHYHKPKTI